MDFGNNHYAGYLTESLFGFPVAFSFNEGFTDHHRLKDDGFVVRQRYFNDRSEGHPIYGVVVYADWTKPPAVAGGDPYLHTYCYLKDDRLTGGGFNLITDE